MNRLIMRLQRRADVADPRFAKQTFVRLDGFSDFLEVPSHQVIYGRRGAGKTHALLYLAETVRENGDLAVYVDMRQLGSSGGIYANPEIPIAQRGTQLLVDILEKLHDQLLAAAIEPSSTDRGFDGILPLLDPLIEAAASVQVVGDVEHEVARSSADAVDLSMSAGVEVSKKPISLSRNSVDRSSVTESSKSVIKGRERPHVIFGSLAHAWRKVAEEIAPKHVWLLLDEWTSIPQQLQPLLADLLRRTLLPLGNVVIKIGAVEGAALFEERFKGGDYLGAELGSDIPIVINLDDHLASFSEGGEVRSEFFAELLSRHIAAVAGDDTPLMSARQSVRLKAFENEEAFAEFVLASEGVPRDGLNILGLAALKAADGPIRTRNVRSAAKDYYLTHKATRIVHNPANQQLLRSLLAEVLGQRRSRMFLLQRDTDARDPRVRELYESRLIHILSRGITSVEDPGTLFDAYVIGYGCYVTALTKEYSKLLGDPWSGEMTTGVAATPLSVEKQVFRLDKPSSRQPRRSRK